MPGSSSVAAQISPIERSTSLPTDTEAGEVDAARLAARQKRADHAAGVRRREDASDRQVRLIERGVGGEKCFVPEVDHAEARRPDEARARVFQELPDPRFSRGTLDAGLAEAVGERSDHRHADPGTFLDRLHRCSVDATM
jgi:hypothetical protein